MNEKSQTLPLPLSTQNEGSLSGTACILEEYVKEFDIPIVEADSYLMYDKVNKTFDIAGARKRYIFTHMLSIHRKDQVILENVIQRKNKESVSLVRMMLNLIM